MSCQSLEMDWSVNRWTERPIILQVLRYRWCFFVAFHKTRHRGRQWPLQELCLYSLLCIYHLCLKYSYSFYLFWWSSILLSCCVAWDSKSLGVYSWHTWFSEHCTGWVIVIGSGWNVSESCWLLWNTEKVLRRTALAWQYILTALLESCSMLTASS